MLAADDPRCNRIIGQWLSLTGKPSSRAMHDTGRPQIRQRLPKPGSPTPSAKWRNGADPQGDVPSEAHDTDQHQREPNAGEQQARKSLSVAFSQRDCCISAPAIHPAGTTSNNCALPSLSLLAGLSCPSLSTSGQEWFAADALTVSALQRAFKTSRLSTAAKALTLPGASAARITLGH